MADYNSRAAALVTGRFLNALSSPFTANRKARSPAPKTPSKNLALGLVKILRKGRKGPSETESDHRAPNRQNREEPNLGSMEQTDPDPGPDPTQIRWWTAPNRVDMDPSLIRRWNAPNPVSTRSAAQESGFWESSGSGNSATYTVLLILVIVSVLVGIYWRFSNGSGAKSLAEPHTGTGWAVRAIPVVLTLILHWLSSSEISKMKSEILVQVFEEVSDPLSRKGR